MSWETPSGEPTQPYGPEPTQPYGQPLPSDQPTAPYPQPQYPYGQPGAYSQPPPQWGQAPGPVPGYGPGYGGPFYEQPPKRRRTGLYVALGAVGVLVAAGVATAVAVSSSNSGSGSPAALSSSSASAAAQAAASPSSTDSPATRNLTVPTSAGPMHLLTNADTAGRIANIKAKLAGNSAYGNPQVGFYSLGSDSSFSVWMLAESAADSTVFRNSVGLIGPTAMARSIANGAKMTDVTPESPGPLGGALLCGKIPAGNGNKVRVCEWVDNSSYGWVYFEPTVNQADVLTDTLYLRGAAEQ